MIVIALLAIMLGIAVPSFADLIKNGRLSAEANELIQDLSYARTEAMRRGKRVSLCVSPDGADCGSGEAWAGGRIVFSDTGDAGELDGDDEVLRVHQSLDSKKVVITASGFSVSSASTLNFVQYRPVGTVTSETAGAFLVCDDRAGNYGRLISVSVTGRSSITTSNASCP